MKRIILALSIALLPIYPATAQEKDVSSEISSMLVSLFSAELNCSSTQEIALALGNIDYAFWYACERLDKVGKYHIDMLKPLKDKEVLSSDDLALFNKHHSEFLEAISDVETTIEQYNLDDSKYYNQYYY